MIFFMLLCSVAFASETQVLPIKSGTAEFFALGKPSMLKIHGTASELSGALKSDGKNFSGDFEIQLEGFKTGMKVRDEHLREKVFEVQKYPKAKLTLDPFQISGPKATEVPFQGKLLFHGVEKAINGKADIERVGDLTRVVAHLELKLTDYAIAPPEFLGMKVQDLVQVEVHQELVSGQ